MAEPQTPRTLVDWLDDLCVRFLLNLPASELSSVPRLCFQVEEAQWFYEDFVRPAAQASGAPLPSLTLRQFCLLLFQHCPLFSGFTNDQHLAAYDEFLAYKVRVPVRGAILLDQKMERLILVRGWKKGASWSFPRGKINKDEKDLDCAIREVYEETGYNLSTSGLIPEDEEDIKYIDITMREQHVRLFVFRGVPEDTYFETKTRKEISKISWYWIKDLPGFKKHNKHQQHNETDTAHANKFYMVAPFLGHLKKWIGMQRKKDGEEAQRRTSSSANGLTAMDIQMATEDESEDHHTPGQRGDTIGHRDEELKKLLNIGAAPSTGEPNSLTATQGGNLLAMLQGAMPNTHSGPALNTPFEQIRAFPSQSEIPHPHHPRPPMLEQKHMGTPPHFPQLFQGQPQEQQRSLPLPTPNIFGPAPGPHGMASYAQPNLPAGILPPYPHQQQFQPRSTVQNPMQFGHQRTELPFNGALRSAMPPPPMNMQHAPPPDAFMAQGPQGAIAGGPAVPSASQLPAPRLNQHTMRLLDTLKAGNSQSAPTIRPSMGNNASLPRPSSTHQAALLSLFKKPSTATRPAEGPAAPSPVEGSASSKPSNMTADAHPPSRAMQRKPTLNEITRTLPSRAKVTSSTEPEVAKPPTPSLVNQKYASGADSVESTIPVSGAAPRPTPGPGNRQSPVRILQRPSAQLDLSSARPTSRSGASTDAPEGRVLTPKENGARSSSFALLTRPESAKGVKSSAPATPTSPLGNETQTPTFQPRLLKRAQSGGAGQIKPTSDPIDKRDQLLALFGKTQSSTTPGPESEVKSQQRTTGIESMHDQPQKSPTANLLDLFNGPPSSHQPPPSPAPPSAPRLTPSSSRPLQSTASTQQNLLLDLFSKHPNTSVTSPSTPISPFTLGTPATTVAPTIGTGKSTVASPTSRGPSGATTPVEAKAFLMGYLNGVVRDGRRKG